MHLALHIGSERGVPVAGAPSDRVYTRVMRDTWRGVASELAMYDEVCVSVMKDSGSLWKRLSRLFR
jgi:hypothetical protein